MKFGVSVIAGALSLFASFSFQNKLSGATAPADQSSGEESGYLGSKICSKCHPSIYESFSRTDMGRSMSEITPALLGRIPTSTNIFDATLKRHFDIFARENSLYQSEYETTADGKTFFAKRANSSGSLAQGRMAADPS